MCWAAMSSKAAACRASRFWRRSSRCSRVQLFVIGIFGEYLARMHFRLMDRPAYTVEVDTASPEPNESPDGDELD